MTKYKQHCGKTQKGAAYRVSLCHAIRKEGFSVTGSKHTTKTLEKLYRKATGKRKLPKRDGTINY